MPLVVEETHRPRAIVLDPSTGTMFWTDWGNNPKIGNAAMDGSMVRDFVVEDIHWPNGLALDHPNGRLYWADAKLKRIESIRINGKDRKRVLEFILKHPYSLAVFENRIYWSDWNTKNVQSCNKFSGKHREILIRDQSVYGIHIYHPALQPKKTHACLNHSCSHLCLLTIKNSYTCGCPDTMILSSDKHNCKGTNIV